MQIISPDPTDAAVVGQVLGARGDIQFEEDGSVLTIADGQTEIDVTFLYEKVFDDYRFIENYIESPVANLSDVRCIIRKEDRKTTGFKVQLSSEHVPTGSIYRWHIKVRDELQVTQPPESQPRYVLSGAFQPLNSQLTMLSTLPVTDFGLGSLNIADAAAFRTYIGAATSSDFGGPYVPTTRTITEGAGLAGNTYTLAANRTLALGTPSTLTVFTTNSASGTTHSHAITSSSNPGAAASLLASDANGRLALTRLTVTDYLFVNNATANLYLKDTSTGFQAATTTVLTPLINNSLQSIGFTSGLVGWNISAAGDAEFNNIRSRGEITASVFKVNELSATAGTLGVFYSAANLSADFTTPSTLGVSFTFHAKNSDSTAMLFGLGDILRFKSWTGSGVSDAWATVTARTNNGVSTTYVATLNSGSTNATFTAGTAVVDYGPSGTGFITLSADGTVGSSPNMTMATHAGSPWTTQTILLRTGNLNGSYGYATNVYGVGFGQYGTAASWLTFDTTAGIRIGNNTNVLGQWFIDGSVRIGRTGIGKNSLFINTSGGLHFQSSVFDVLTIDGTDGIRIISPADGTTILGQWDASGNVTFGQVATDQANVYWNNSNKRLQFRGSTNGTVVQSYIDTDGSFIAGAGNVQVNATGLSLIATTAANTVNMVTWHTAGNTDPTMQLLNVYTGGGASVGAMRVRNKTTDTTPTSSAGLEALGATSAKATSLYVVETQATDSGYAYVTNTGTLTGFVIGGSTAPTHMLEVYGTGYFTGALAFLVGGAIKTAEVGAADSGGAGYKMLRVPN